MEACCVVPESMSKESVGFGVLQKENMLLCAYLKVLCKICLAQALGRCKYKLVAYSTQHVRLVVARKCRCAFLRRCNVGCVQLCACVLV